MPTKKRFVVDSPDSPPDPESKTQRKKQMLGLQKLGETLVNLPAAQFAKIPLEPQLLEAITIARELTVHEAKRRQLQYIGRLMRTVDVTLIQAALDKIVVKDQASKAQFHQAEFWRNKLIAEGDVALTELMAKFPEADSQQLRQLIRKAQQDIKLGKKSGADTLLFRCVRELFVN